MAARAKVEALDEAFEQFRAKAGIRWSTPPVPLAEDGRNLNQAVGSVVDQVTSCFHELYTADLQENANTLIEQASAILGSRYERSSSAGNGYVGTELPQDWPPLVQGSRGGMGPYAWGVHEIWALYRDLQKKALASNERIDYPPPNCRIPAGLQRNYADSDYPMYLNLTVLYSDLCNWYAPLILQTDNEGLLKDLKTLVRLVRSGDEYELLQRHIEQCDRIPDQTDLEIWGIQDHALVEQAHTRQLALAGGRAHPLSHPDVRTLVSQRMQ